MVVLLCDFLCIINHGCENLAGLVFVYKIKVKKHVVVHHILFEHFNLSLIF